MRRRLLYGVTISIYTILYLVLYGYGSIVLDVTAAFILVIIFKIINGLTMD